ncbi:MAG: hypothetical protein IJ365_03735 [Clostridia bacterium]|nr:hypothetical protein [Clostridia bacterium]
MPRPDGIFAANINNRYFYMSRWCILLIFAATLLGFLGEVLIVYASVIVHECCHLLVCRRFNISTRYIALMPYGMELKLAALVPPGKQIAISMAGPLCNFALFAAGRAVLVFCQWDYAAFFTSANFILFVFNLFPCMPLDGGEILRCAISLRCGILNSYRIISRLSYICGVVMFAAGIVFVVYTGGNITLLIIALPVFVSIAKLKVTCIYAAKEVVAGDVPRGKKRRLVVMNHTDAAARCIKHISFGYSLIVAVRRPGGEIALLTQNELLWCVNCKNTYATLGECVEICANL